MDAKEFAGRTKRFALRVMRLTGALPRTDEARIIGRQLFRAATSVGANYRAATRAKSDADFVAKMGIVEEECDECLYWMELLTEGDIVRPELLGDLTTEANEILLMVVASIRTVRTRLNKAG